MLLLSITVTEEKLHLAQEHIESLEQQLADSEKKVTEADQKGIYLPSFTSAVVFLTAVTLILSL